MSFLLNLVIEARLHENKELRLDREEKFMQSNLHWQVELMLILIYQDLEHIKKLLYSINLKVIKDLCSESKLKWWTNLNCLERQTSQAPDHIPNETVMKPTFYRHSKIQDVQSYEEVQMIDSLKPAVLVLLPVPETIPWKMTLEKEVTMCFQNTKMQMVLSLGISWKIIHLRLEVSYLDLEHMRVQAILDD